MTEHLIPFDVTKRRLVKMLYQSQARNRQLSTELVDARKSRKRAWTAHNAKAAECEAQGRVIEAYRQALGLKTSAERREEQRESPPKEYEYVHVCRRSDLPC